MEFVNVKTQDELERAVANGDIPVCRDGFFRAFGSATVRAFGSATVEAFGSATVRAFDSATVRAFDSATVRASDSATVRASDSATVRAFGSATVEAFGSATVRASDSATVRASDSATVRAFDSATVRAFGSATVRASDSATVRAFGSATVRAFDSATVEAFDSATVRASDFVAIHRHGDTPKVAGGVLIQVPALTTAAEFCAYYGVDIKRGSAILFKAVGEDWRSKHGTDYAPGTKVSCDDWKAEPYCGGGLHFSPRPFMTRRYSDGPRLVACQVKLNEIVVIGDSGQPDKVKAPSCKVLYECDEDGNEVASVEAKAA